MALAHHPSPTARCQVGVDTLLAHPWALTFDYRAVSSGDQTITTTTIITTQVLDTMAGRRVQWHTALGCPRIGVDEQSAHAQVCNHISPVQIEPNQHMNATLCSLVRSHNQKSNPHHPNPKPTHSPSSRNAPRTSSSATPSLILPTRSPCLASTPTIPASASSCAAYPSPSTRAA